MISKLKDNRIRHNFVILGDFNIDVQRKRNPDREKFNVFCKENDLTQLIDLILTDTKYPSLYASDHLLVYLSIKKQRETYTKTRFTGRSYATYDKNVLQTNLKNLNWGRFMVPWM